MEFYWEIIRRDEPPVYIPPASVADVRKRWDEHQPIHTTHGSIPYHQIVDFRISTKPFSDQPLLEEASQAFHSPLLTEDGIQTKWVKKLVPTRMYQKHYAAIPSYHKLSEQSGMTWIAFQLPVHLIDRTQVEDCSEEEKNRLTS